MSYAATTVISSDTCRKIVMSKKGRTTSERSPPHRERIRPVSRRKVKASDY